MGAISFFHIEGNEQLLSGSSFGEPDGTEHMVDLLEGNQKMILRVELQGQKTKDLVFTPEQALAFADAVDGVLGRLSQIPGYQRPKEKR